MRLRCTVVIPTHNRCASLARLLDALARQNVAPGSFDVVVVLDGCEDASAEFLASWQGPPAVTVVRQARSGQAAARNAGARAASAPVLLFLDDDVEATPELVAAHLAHHGDPSVVVLGDCPVVRRGDDSLYRVSVWWWWEETLQRRARPDHVVSHLDFMSGNVSLTAALFADVGGFDERFRGYGAEDYELGWRLLGAGARFVVAPEAVAWHHHDAELRLALAHARDEGRADVLFGRLHPAVRGSLRLAAAGDPAAGALVRRVFRSPRLWQRAVLAAGLVELRWCERVGRPRRWAARYRDLRAYAYWQGVRDELRTLDAVVAFTGEPRSPAILDISHGLPVTLPDLLGASSRVRVRVVAGGLTLGTALLEVPPAGDLNAHVARQLVEQIGDRLAMAAVARRGWARHD